MLRLYNLSTLARGVRYLDDYMAKAATKTVDGASTFFLYDSLGFPLDLTTLMAAEEGFDVDAVAFQEEMDLQKSRSRGDRATRRAKQLGVLVIDLGTAAVADLALAGVCATVSDHGAPTVPSSAILASYTVDAEGSVIKSAKVDGNIGLVLETSNFYAEGGGRPN
ncbi:alanyl-tRNA synthetase [Pelagophyceae sp. CCMP2097]|nr:alanyl-tRNA synthetase [Pelagophyceae sp. CCMP2097]